MKLRRFSGLSLRNLRTRVQRTLLTAIGIVLGVGIVFGVLTLSETMAGAFGNLFSRAFGAADLTVTAAGGNGPFDEGAVEEVRGIPEVQFAAPRLSQPASLLLPERDENGMPQVKNLRVLGSSPRRRLWLRTSSSRRAATRRRMRRSPWMRAPPKRLGSESGTR